MAWREWRGSFSLMDHTGDGNPKEKMKKTERERGEK